jgi:hypothetical protein
VKDYINHGWALNLVDPDNASPAVESKQSDGSIDAMVTIQQSTVNNWKDIKVIYLSRRSTIIFQKINGHIFCVKNS